MSRSCLNLLFSRLLLTSFILTVSSLAFGQSDSRNTTTLDPKWKLIWNDEFETSTLGLPDSTKWLVSQETGHPSNNELQYYTNRTQNIRIENGILIFQAHKENFTGPNGASRAYTSARISTTGLFTVQYGRIEARLKLPTGQGLWPAFWMLGANYDSTPWPACGEIDIMENLGSDSKTSYGTIHGPGYAGSEGVGKSITVESNFSEKFHVFAVEWTAEDMKFYIDDFMYSHLKKEDVLKIGPWVFDAPQVLILNLAVGGWWPGKPNESTVFPNQMEIDYVRVYKERTAPQ